MIKSQIIKHDKRVEEYDERKLYASVYAACLALRESEATAALIASQVGEEVAEWLAHKSEVTAHDLRIKAAHYLEAYNPEASYLYLHHRNIS